MAEPPTQLYRHLVGTPEEVVERLDQAGLLTPKARLKKPEIAEAIRQARDEYDRKYGSHGPPGPTVDYYVQRTLYPFLNDGGRRLAESSAE
jgi:hypothetical protein